jgi:hypothetical protein
VRSNCHLEAWRAYRAGEATVLIFRPTEYSRAAVLAAHPLWWPLRWLGTALQWLAWPAVQLGEWLRTGRWWHVQWRAADGRTWEYQLLRDGEPDTQTRHWTPPVWYAGQVQEVSDD